MEHFGLGPMLELALKAAEMLAERGIDIAVDRPALLPNRL